MMRVGGLSYICTPSGAMGSRISGLTLDSGRPLEAGKRYKVAGWASVDAQQGAPVWDVVAKYLRAGGMPERGGSGVTLKGVDGNPGIAGQG
jgi:sulfur-oxidizing protein SoxB